MGTEFHVGMRVRQIGQRFGRVINIDDTGTYPVDVEFDDGDAACFTRDGRQWEDDAHGQGVVIIPDAGQEEGFPPEILGEAADPEPVAEAASAISPEQMHQFCRQLNAVIGNIMEGSS